MKFHMSFDALYGCVILKVLHSEHMWNIVYVTTNYKCQKYDELFDAVMYLTPMKLMCYRTLLELGKWWCSTKIYVSDWKIDELHQLSAIHFSLTRSQFTHYLCVTNLLWPV